LAGFNSKFSNIVYTSFGRNFIKEKIGNQLGVKLLAGMLAAATGVTAIEVGSTALDSYNNRVFMSDTTDMLASVKKALDDELCTSSEASEMRSKIMDRPLPESSNKRIHEMFSQRASRTPT